MLARFIQTEKHKLCIICENTRELILDIAIYTSSSTAVKLEVIYRSIACKRNCYFLCSLVFYIVYIHYFKTIIDTITIKSALIRSFFLNHWKIRTWIYITGLLLVVLTMRTPVVSVWNAEKQFISLYSCLISFLLLKTVITILCIL